jgi:adrenodoxin-NADP+ reductase
MTEAFKVGQTISNNLLQTNLPAKNNEGFAQVQPILKDRKVRPVSFEDWQKIDQVEKSKGETSGKPREKFTNVSDMMSQLD